MMKRGDGGIKTCKWENQNWIPLRVINYSSMRTWEVKRIRGHWSRFHSLLNVRSQNDDNFHHSSSTKHSFKPFSNLHVFLISAFIEWWRTVIEACGTELFTQGGTPSIRLGDVRFKDRAEMCQILGLPSHQPSEKSVEKHVNKPSSLVYHANVRGFSIKHFSLTLPLMCLVRTWKYWSVKASVANISRPLKAFRR